MVSLKVLSALAFGVHVGAVTTTVVSVGTDGVVFTPDTITAAVGDVLEFHFYTANHSVAMGDYDNPCQPAKTGGFFSGYVPVASGVSVSLPWTNLSKQYTEVEAHIRSPMSLVSRSTARRQHSSTARRTSQHPIAS
jgi:hypothetical protein